MKSTENLWLRTLFLALLIFVINSWSIHHFGDKVTNLFLANGPLMLVAIINFLIQILTKKETSKITEKIRAWFFFFLKTPILIILFCLFFTVGSIVSSVTLMSDGMLDKMKVNLAPEGSSPSKHTIKELYGPNDVIRYIKFTSPFGQAFYLEVEGYLRHSFDLYPWVGKKVRVVKDLSISPSILIRVPIGVQLFLPKGKIVVVSNDSVIAESKTNARQGSIIVGHNVSIPNAFVEKWKRELIADKVEESAAALSLLTWQQPKAVPSSERLFPGKTIVVKFLIEGNKIKASNKFKIGSEEIQDVLMLIEEEIP